MKRTWKTACVLSSALCLLVVTQAMGQVRQPGQERAAQRQPAGQKKICLASKLTEMTVKDKSNQNLGKIEDLVIDQTGQVHYLAISTQAQAGGQSRTQPGQQDRAAQTPGARQAAAGAKLTLVPFEAVEIHEGEAESENYVSVNIDKDRLTQAPSFTKQQMTAQTGQAQWMSQVDQFFQREKSGAARPELNQKQPQQPQRERE